MENRMTKGLFPKAVVTFLLMLMAAVVVSGSALADTFTVTRTNDPAPNGCKKNDCSLREAVRKANANPGSDVIKLPKGTHELSRAGIGEDAALTGDLDITDPVSITGAGTRTTIVDANGLDRVFDVTAPTRFVNFRITGGDSDDNGGGIQTDSDLSLFQISLVGNEATDDGGAMDIDSTPTVRISRTTIASNTATSDAGGIEMDGGRLLFVNSTASNNEAVDDDGGVIDNDSDPGDSIEILNSTFTANTAGGDGGAISDGENVELRNSIIAGNTDGAAGTATDNCAKSNLNDYDSLGNNLENTDGCDLDAASDLPNTPAGLGPLANNGGSTNTHRLLASSAALDAASNAAAPATDQRGVKRPQEGDGNPPKRSDIGAFERKP